MNVLAPAYVPIDVQLLRQLTTSNETLQQEVKSLKHQLAWFKQQMFGEKSEKRLTDDNPYQTSIAELLITTEPQVAPPTEKITYTRRKKQRGDDCVTDQGLRFTDDVPVEVIEMNAPELSGPDADQYEVIDYKVTRRLAQRPGSYVVLEYRRPVTRHKTNQTLQTVPAPSGLFDRSFADVSLIAGLLIDKFAYHLPLYRQHQRMEMAGITVSRTSLTQWVQSGIELLRPIVDEGLLPSVLQSRVLAMDETPVKAGRKEKGKMQRAWFWPLYGEQDEVVFTFSTTKSVKHMEPLLEDWQGILLTDGNPVYDSYCKTRDHVTLAQCWVHARRYFVKSEADEPAATAVALEYIGQLYKTEKVIRESNLTGEQKKARRQSESKPVVNTFFDWCHNERQRIDLVANNPLSRALVYANNHQEQMRVFLSEPGVPLDTNHLERSLRCIPMGRKNWMFCWTEVGAEHVAIIQSLLISCRLQGIDPYKYLVDVLQRVSLHPARHVQDLIPRNWKGKFGTCPLKADLGK